MLSVLCLIKKDKKKYPERIQDVTTVSNGFIFAWLNQDPSPSPKELCLLNYGCYFSQSVKVNKKSRIFPRVSIMAIICDYPLKVSGKIFLEGTWFLLLLSPTQTISVYYYTQKWNKLSRYDPVSTKIADKLDHFCKNVEGLTSS